MTVYIAFLRGINVGGKNKIKMADLKCVFEDMGLVRVETYIQSGNVIFESDEPEITLRTKVEHEIERNFGIPASVILRTSCELERLINVCPFSEEEIMKAEALNSEGESLYVNLLTEVPDEEKIEYLNRLRNEKDDFRIINRDMYLLFFHSIRKSKLANSLQKLETPSTVRNWKTINKLMALAKSRATME